MQSPTRTENLPVPITPVFRGPLVERADYSRWNGNGYAHGYAPPPPVPHPDLVHGSHTTYFQVLFQQVMKRWKFLAVWLAITAAAALFVVTKYAKPTWKAEGLLYYSPDNSYSHKRLYTPPNIQTILALTKSPTITDKVSQEYGVSDLQAKLNVNLVKSSEFISVAYDAADKQKAEGVVRQAMAQAIDQYEQLRYRLSKDAVADLDSNLDKAKAELLAAHLKMNEAMEKRGIFNLREEISSTQRDIEDFKKAINAATDLKDQKETAKGVVERKIKDLTEGNGNKGGALTEADLTRLSRIREEESRKSIKKTELEAAQIDLKANLETRQKLLPLYQKGHITQQEWLELEAKIAKNKSVIANCEGEIRQYDALIEQLKKSGVAALPVEQARYDLLQIEAELSAFPKKIGSLQQYLKEKQDHLKFLLGAQNEALHIQQEIDTLQQRYNNLVGLKQEHEKLDKKGSGELTVHSPASAGNSPASSNTLKLGAATFGLALLLFFGFIALFDMPKTIHAAPSAPNTGLPAPGSQLPVPVWYHQQPTPMPQYAPPPAPHHNPQPGHQNGFVNEHLRALAERIAFNPDGKGKIVLFTPTAHGLGVENLLGDLACHLTRETGRVLVFEARTDIENPAFPAWTGPSSREAAEHTINYLEGRSERSTACFAETLISQIDYARADLTRHLQSVMAMYRFRRLVNEMRERYALVLMITPERYRGEEDDVFTTLGDGIVVVINHDADPSDVEQYLRGLSACETPVYGAFTVPSANGTGHPSRA